MFLKNNFHKTRVYQVGNYVYANFPRTLTYSRFLPNLTNAVWKHWKILGIGTKFQELFQKEPITALKRTTNLK